jgi:hypothetical protein
LAELEKTNLELQSRVLRSGVAAKYGVPAERLIGSTLDELEADAQELAKLVGRGSPTGFDPEPKTLSVPSGAKGDSRAAAALRDLARRGGI